MSDFIQEFMEQFGPQTAQAVADNLGIRKKAANAVIPEVIPLIFGGLKRQMEQQGGAARLDHILNKYGSSEVLGRIDQEVATRAAQGSADPRLGGLLGDAGVQASQMVANKFKIDPSVAMKLIPILAPIILGALTKRKESVSPGTLPGSGSESGLDSLAGMIDRNGDGSILDDVAGMFLGGQSGAGSSGGGLLGSILGGLFGRKR